MTEQYGFIYMLRNKINNKVYIGQSIDLVKRMDKYKNLRCKSQPHIYNALKKHGWDNFDKLILDTCYTDECELTILEQHCMDKFNSLDKRCGYNDREAGTRGRHSEKSKVLMSEAKRGKTHLAETKRLISESCKGNKHYNFGKTASKEAKAKFTEAHRHEMHAVESIDTGQTFESIRDCSRIMNIPQSSLHRHLKGQAKHVKGFHFRYINK